MKGLTPQYLVNPIPPPRRHLFGVRHANVCIPVPCRTKMFQKSFYPDGVKCWNNIGPDFRNMEPLSKFKSEVLKIIRPVKNSTFNIHNPLGMKYIYQLRVGVSALSAHKKAHNFRDTSDDTCLCSIETRVNNSFLT